MDDNSNVLIIFLSQMVWLLAVNSHKFSHTVHLYILALLYGTMQANEKNCVHALHRIRLLLVVYGQTI